MGHLKDWGDYPDTLPRINPHAERIERLEAEYAELQHFYDHASGQTAFEAMRAKAHLREAINFLKKYEVDF
jgi:hypothetical protein